jgi:Icc-related predicted phosphoesterase
MSGRLRIFYVSDLHGSERCFRKFLNGASVYKADVLVLGGDVAGKAVQPVTRLAGGRYACHFHGVDYDVGAGDGLEDLERLIADQGFYAYRAEPGEMDEMTSAGTLDTLFLKLMKERLAGWTRLADERLRPLAKQVYWMLGNDDPEQLAEVLDSAPWGVNVDNRVVPISDDHEMVSLGYSNLTPWHSPRELSENPLGAMLEELRAQVRAPERAVLNLHVPPYDTSIDQAPVLDANLQVQTALGQVKFAPAGSTAVRALIESMQPLLGLHGHIHEAHGFRMLGRTLVINPGSDYGTGSLDGALVTLERDRVKAHQFVRG